MMAPSPKSRSSDPGLDGIRLGPRRWLAEWLIILGISTCLTEATAVRASTDADLALIRTRLLAPVMKPVDGSTTAALLATLQEDGSWSDVDYANASTGNWITVHHLARLQKLTRSVVVPGSDRYEDVAVQAAVMRALDYWLREDFINSNWWWNQIGVPRSLAQTLLLLEDRLSEWERAEGMRIVSRARLGGSGANLADLATITLMQALLKHDAELAATAVNAMTAEIRLTTDEGIQPDWSFHQHGALLYNHGYGAVFMDNTTRLARVVAGTEFAFPRDKLDLLDGLILDGTAWMIRHDTKDYGATGRGISRAAGSSGSAAYLRGIAANMLAVGSGREADYHRLRAYLDGGAPVFTGNRHFFRSDFMAHQRAEWYASVRMFSDRLRNTDTPYNGEGLLSHHLADGCTYLMRSGREYHDIFPVWNWWEIPGTTVELTPELERPVARIGSRAFAGGVSDGTYGAAGFDFERDGLIARKAWFLFDDEMVALGAGIGSSSGYPVITTVNQCFLHGEVTHGKNGTVETLKRGTWHLEGNDWLHHDGITYVFPQPADVELSCAAATGNWWHINHNYSKDPVTRDVFTLTIHHGVDPSGATYAYVAAPGVGRDQAAAYAADPPVRVLANTPAVQAVEQMDLGLVGAIFYASGSVSLPGDVTLSVDRPCALLVRPDSAGAAVTGANPLSTGGRLTVGFSGAWSGQVRIDFPEGDLGGKSVAARWNRPSPTAITDGPPRAESPAGDALRVRPNYPNPFNGATVIRYVLPAGTQVDLAVYNLRGQRVATLAAGARGAGEHSVRWDGRDDRGRVLASGVYLYRLRAAGCTRTGRLLAAR